MENKTIGKSIKTTIGIILIIVTFNALAVMPRDAKLTASDGSGNELFGVSVAVDGNTAVIGAANDDDIGIGSGSAYVFVRDARGRWTQQDKLIASDASSSDSFGTAVAIDGDTALVSAQFAFGIANESGAVYVFKRDESGHWAQQAKLINADGDLSDWFGFSVSLDGDTALIGAVFNDGAGISAGASYVFVRNADGLWTQQAKLIASDGDNFDSFGYSVSLDGDTALIGSRNNDGAGTNSGAAYVFVKNANGIWIEKDKLTATDGVFADNFGVAVALDGKTALIGASGDSDNGISSGSAYVFVRSSGRHWTQRTKLTASDGAAFDEFGGRGSVALSRDIALVGALRNGGEEESSGAAYMFIPDARGRWRQKAKLTASDGSAFDRYGCSVSVDGRTALIGALAAKNDHEENSGAAYVLSLPKKNGIRYSSSFTCGLQPTPEELSSCVRNLWHGLPHLHSREPLDIFSGKGGY